MSWGPSFPVLRCWSSYSSPSRTKLLRWYNLLLFPFLVSAILLLSVLLWIFWIYCQNNFWWFPGFCPVHDNVEVLSWWVHVKQSHKHLPGLAKLLLDLHGLFSLPWSDVLLHLLYVLGIMEIRKLPQSVLKCRYIHCWSYTLSVLLPIQQRRASHYAKKWHCLKLTNFAGVFFLWYHDSICYFPTVWDDFFTPMME